MGLPRCPYSRRWQSQRCARGAVDRHALNSDPCPAARQLHLSSGRRQQKRKQTKSGTTPYPNGASASAPRVGRNGRGQRRGTRETGGSARAERERCTSTEANTQEAEGTASSATEAPTKRTMAAITQHTASRRERGQPCRKKKGFKSQGMQSAQTASASKEST
jgi:hypothetical protein